jgi:hypothetical protein
MVGVQDPVPIAGLSKDDLRSEPIMGRREQQIGEEESHLGCRFIVTLFKTTIKTCETWVSLVPHRPGSRPSPTSGSGLLEDPPTCQWAQLT